MESKKNSSKLTDEESGENTLKITKNDPYNLETRFMHKDQLYWENQTSTRCENITPQHHSTIWGIGGISHFLLFPLLHHEAHPHLSKSNYG
jgi:hypothetical protein